MRPILFNTPMVQAILDGRKTQTRRIVKNEKIENPYYQLGNHCYFIEDFSKTKIGDILYVKETYGRDLFDNIYYKATHDGDERVLMWKSSLFMPKKDARIFLKVTNVRIERLQDISEEDAIAEGIKRIGDGWKDYDFKDNSKYNYRYLRAIDSYKSLWNSINKKDPASQWQANPYVFVYEFKRVKMSEDDQ